MNNYLATFPEAIDNTMRKSLVKCEQSAHYRFELGLQSKLAKRVDLIAGGAFAAGIEAVRREFYVEHKPAGEAAQIGVQAVFEAYGDFQCPRDSNKSVQRVAGALLHYLERYPLQLETKIPFLFPDGKAAIEMHFSFPIPIHHPETGKQLEYCGNFDLLALDMDDGGLWVVDEKTTSSMGDKWANQWPLDAQMTGYCWGAQKILDAYGCTQKLKGAIINGIAIKKYDYDCGRFPTYREEWEIQRWYDQMLTDVQDWKNAFTNVSHKLNLDHSCAYYLNPCEFAPLCKSRSPAKLFEGSYVVEFWNPKDRSKKV